MIECVDVSDRVLAIREFLAGKPHTAEADEIIVSTGFRPNLEMIRSSCS